MEPRPVSESQAALSRSMSITDANSAGFVQRNRLAGRAEIRAGRASG